jgi:hypothetical protein
MRRRTVRSPHALVAGRRWSGGCQVLVPAGDMRTAWCTGLALIGIFSWAGTGGMLAAATSSYGKDAMEPGFAAAEIDTSKPHPARMYNAYLGGCFR